MATGWAMKRLGLWGGWPVDLLELHTEPSSDGIVGGATKLVCVRLPPPPTANRYWRMAKTRLTLTPTARAYKEGVAAVLSTVNPIEGPARVTVRWFRHGQTGDLDNRLKVLLDAVQGSLFRNDKQICELHAYSEPADPDMPLERPHVTITAETV